MNLFERTYVEEEIECTGNNITKQREFQVVENDTKKVRTSSKVLQSIDLFIKAI